MEYTLAGQLKGIHCKVKGRYMDSPDRDNGGNVFYKEMQFLVGFPTSCLEVIRMAFAVKRIFLQGPNPSRNGSLALSRD